MKGPRASVLVVDDDPSLRLLCRVNLELDGFDVREAATVDEARAAVAEGRPDVIMLDVYLGGQSSDAFLGEAHEAGIPVAIVTGAVDAPSVRGRANEVLVKPFVPERLVAAARRLARVGDP